MLLRRSHKAELLLSLSEEMLVLLHHLLWMLLRCSSGKLRSTRCNLLLLLLDLLLELVYILEHERLLWLLRRLLRRLRTLRRAYKKN